MTDFPLTKSQSSLLSQLTIVTAFGNDPFPVAQGCTIEWAKGRNAQKSDRIAFIAGVISILNKLSLFIGVKMCFGHQFDEIIVFVAKF
jgi:hypothetical protein